ncbi:S8 family peptidase [Deinococcus radiotolerans]|uniref:S8 family peptidase n=1 Tax=Deinococcus radiotolerans TaxID=1309407 RepID=UPI001E41C170|nr:S8 family serine peptidase [Deinococcus radiotolerans]
MPGRVLVSSVPGGSQLSTLGVQAQAVAPGLAVVTAPAGQEAALASRLHAQGAQVQPDYLYQSLATPNDPGVPGNVGVPIGGARYVQTYLTRVKAPDAWAFLQSCGKQPEAASTAVLDSLVNTSHPDLQSRLGTARSYLNGTPSDTSGHGTATTGEIAATTNNSQGLAGMTWSGAVLPMEVIGQTGASTTTITQAVNDAVKLGVKVLNMSLGAAITTASDPDPALSSALTTAAKSVVIVAAAGNEPGKGLFYPASHPDVIAVGAAGADDAPTCYSAQPSAAQPGSDTHYMLAPGGTGACAGAMNATQMLLLNQAGGYTLEAGTSFAAPLVSGAAALMRAANPNLSAATTRDILLTSARKTNSGTRFLDVNAAVRAATR